MSAGPAARVVAVDVGTSAVRAALVAGDGTILEQHRTPRSSGVGGEQFDPTRLHEELLDAVARVADPCCEALAIAAHIGAVAVDGDLRPVVPGGGWSDPRGLDVLRGVDADLADDLRRRAARPVLTGGALALLLSLAPEDRQRVRAVLSPKDYLVARLTGEVAADVVDAAYTMGLDVRAGSWDRESLDRLGLPVGAFPRLCSPIDVVGTLDRGAATATGLTAGLPVVSGGPDGSVGIGLLLGSRTDAIADVAGTTDVIGRLTRGEEPLGAVLNPAMLAGRIVAGGATGMTGGAVARWRALLGRVTDEALSAVPPGSEGLHVVPSMSGERFPAWRHRTTGSVLGQRPHHDAVHLTRAVHEAAAFTVREGVDLLDPTGAAPVVLAGGSAHSDFVTRLRADVLRRPMLVAPRPDVTLLGAAALAMVAVGVIDDLDLARDRLVGPLREVVPSVPEAYASLYERWRAQRDRLAIEDEVAA